MQCCHFDPNLSFAPAGSREGQRERHQPHSSEQHKEKPTDRHQAYGRGRTRQERERQRSVHAGLDSVPHHVLLQRNCLITLTVIVSGFIELQVPRSLSVN